MQSTILVLLTMSVIALFIYWIWQNKQHERSLQLRVKKLYASQLFEELIPLLRVAKKRHIEQLIVDKTGIIIRYLKPDQSENAFFMHPNGYAYLTPEQQEAVRAVLEDCLPKLKDDSRYIFSRKRVRLVNGSIEFVNHYIISNAYKSMINRAPYYDGTLRTHLW